MAKGKDKKSSIGLIDIMLNPWLRIIGGLFSIVAAVFFGRSQLSKRKKKTYTEDEARVASVLLLVNLQPVREHLEGFQNWLNNQESELEKAELQKQLDMLLPLYRDWTSHEKMESILNTVQYDPKIGMNISDGLYELHSITGQLEKMIKSEKLSPEEALSHFSRMNEQVDHAITCFSYSNQELESKLLNE